MDQVKHHHQYEIENVLMDNKDEAKNRAANSL